MRQRLARVCLHNVRRGHADELERDLEVDADGVARDEAGPRDLGVDGTTLARKDLAVSVEAVERAGELLREVRQAERRTVARAAGDEVRELGDLAGERGLGRIGQEAEVGSVRSDRSAESPIAFWATFSMPSSSASSSLTPAALRRMEQTRACAYWT